MKLTDAETHELRNAAQTLISQIQSAQKAAQDRPEWGPRNPDEFCGYRKMLKVAPAIGGRFSPELTAELKAVCSMLRCMIAGEDYREDDLKILVRCLNLGISELEGWFAHFLAGEPRILAARCPLLRFIADDLVRFSRLLVKDEERWKQNPIAVCPYCDGLYLKTKSNQEFCSTKCRVGRWGKTKGKAYFAKKQQEFRKNKKEARKRKQCAVIKAVRESIAAGKAALEAAGDYSASLGKTTTESPMPKKARS
jgi:hypothetical protein